MELSVDESARHIAMLEDGTDVPTQQITNVRTSLKRSHRDPLVSVGAVTYETGQVVAGANYGRVVRTLASGISSGERGGD